MRVGVLVGPAGVVAVGVGVRVGVGVGVRVGVAVWVGVGVAVGPSTVKIPFVRLVSTPPPPGSVAAALLNEREEPPTGAPGNTSKVTLTIVPSGIGSTLNPKIMIRTLSAVG